MLTANFFSVYVTGFCLLLETREWDEETNMLLLQAAMYPGAQVFWSKWSPPHERSRLVAFAFGGESSL